MERRKFIRHAGLLTSGMIIPGIIQTMGKQDATILVVSGWQDVNIGDIAHTPGLLHVLETYIPEANIILWKRSKGQKGEAVHELLNHNFPKVRVIYGNVDDQHNLDSPKVRDAFEESDIMVHGSGPSVVGRTNLQAWVKETDKPFGIFGTTIQHINAELKALLEKASFIYTRETKSLDVLKEAGLSGKNISFAPDATFFLNIHDHRRADHFLNDHELEEKKFVCVIPRLRVTPYYKIRENHNYSEERIREIESLNKSKKEWDHGKLREAMIRWVRNTGNKVLVCPEMTYQVDIMDELLIDPLPDDVKPYVVKRGYWMPDEAASIYEKAHTVLSFECHSPIIAATNGTPCFYLRQPEDTIKGQMWYDLNFGDWIFEIEETTGKQISDRLMSVWNNYDAAKQHVSRNMNKIAEIYADSCYAIKNMST